MRILQIAPIERRLPVLKYGGIERMVSTLCEHLVARGHSVTLLAADGSTSSALVQSLASVPLCEADPPIWQPKQREVHFVSALANVLSTIATQPFDVVHNHLGWRLLPLHRISPAPFFTTLQIPLHPPEKAEVWNACKTSPVVCVSESQRAARPDLNCVATIHMGIEIERYSFSPRGNGHLVFLGRIAREKGIVEAIQLAKRLRRVLIIAAAIDEWEKPYFIEQVAPLLDSSIRFIGEINDHEKCRLLGDADALLNPIQWEEPFGLACIEAMACGTPVATLKRGSMSEIVKDGITGIVADSTDALLGRFGELVRLDRRTCRQHVAEQFSAQSMVDKHEVLYESAPRPV